MTGWGRRRRETSSARLDRSSGLTEREAARAHRARWDELARQRAERALEEATDAPAPDEVRADVSATSDAGSESGAMHPRRGTGEGTPDADHQVVADDGATAGGDHRRSDSVSVAAGASLFTLRAAMARSGSSCTDQQLRAAIRSSVALAIQEDAGADYDAACLLVAARAIGKIRTRSLARLLGLKYAFVEGCSRRWLEAGVWRVGRHPGLTSYWEAELARCDAPHALLLLTLLAGIGLGWARADCSGPRPTWTLTEHGGRQLQGALAATGIASA